MLMFLHMILSTAMYNIYHDSKANITYKANIITKSTVNVVTFDMQTNEMLNSRLVGHLVFLVQIRYPDLLWSSSDGFLDADST